MKIKFKIKNLKLKIILLSFIFYLLSFIYPCFSEDRILAVVNSEIITQKDLDDFTNFMKLQTQKEYPKSELLERLIEDRLILQAALKENLNVEKSRIDKRIEVIKSRYSSIEEFESALLTQGLDPADLELKVKEQILMFDIIEEKIRKNIFVSPQEVTDYYLKNPEEFVEPEKRKILSISIEDPEIAQKIREEFLNFKDFEEIALKYQLQIEDLGWVNKEQLRSEISEVVFKLKKGEFSPFLSLDEKFYIFKIEDLSEEKKIDLKDAQEKISNLIFEEKMEIELENWLRELKRNSYIKVYNES